MLLRPNQTKYNKTFKGRNNSKIELKSNELKFGTYGLKALEKGRITARQIEAVRRTLAGLTKRKSKI
jgi:large subunit ribosomal protein L16